MTTVERIAAIRLELESRSLAACIITDSDPHQSEYPALHFKRRSFISGFEGSQGTLVVTADKAGLWTDSRYWLQAENDCRDTGIEVFHQGDADVLTLSAWLCIVLKEGSSVSCWGAAVSPADFRTWEKELARHSIDLSSTEDISALVWHDRPDLPDAPIVEYQAPYELQSTKEKLELLQGWMDQQSLEWYLVSDLAEIAWLLNLRGNDIPYNPVFYAWLLVSKQSSTLFVGRDKLSAELQIQIHENIIELADYQTIGAFLQTLPADDRLLISPQSINMDIILSAAHMHLREELGIIGLWKAKKNKAEIAALNDCYLKDSVAVLKTLAWVDTNLQAGTVLNEHQVGLHVSACRQEISDYRGESFPPIVASGPNAAIVHYQAPLGASRPLSLFETLLVDCGGQFLGGTTDSTRVIAFGPANDAQRRAYTLVLKGHLALANAVFPVGTTGAQLDTLARQFLWQEGCNYGHGTGHGIGMYLNVHEGPQRISPLGYSVALEPGMVVSDEPGFYLADRFGVRIENILIVEEHPKLSGFLCFRSLTLLPYEPYLIDPSLLCASERQYLDGYNALLNKKLKSKLSREALSWLQRCTTMPWQS